MIDYPTYCKIHDAHQREGLNKAQIARLLGLDVGTVCKWLARSCFEQRKSSPRLQQLDTFKPLIVRWLDTHPYSAQQIFQRLKEAGYQGGVTRVRDYVRSIRPPSKPV